MSGNDRAGVRHSSAAAFEARHEAETNDGLAGFTRRCGRRAPSDKRPCMHMYGHGGPHAWEPSIDAQQ
jgi:hypothetical protein